MFIPTISAKDITLFQSALTLATTNQQVPAPKPTIRPARPANDVDVALFLQALAQI